jgi:hypothetical protein
MGRSLRRHSRHRVRPVPGDRRVVAGPEAARRAGLEGVEKSLPAPSTAWTRRSGTLACFAPTPSYRWSSRLLLLAARGPGRGSRRPPQAWPAPRPPPRRWTGRCRLRWSGCRESRIWQGRLVSQADLYPGVPSRSLLRARRWACPLCTSLTHSQPGLADGPTRGSLGTWASRRACTYARSWSMRACT